MKCPRCPSTLQPIEYDGVVVQVCPGCKGEWLEAGELQQLVQHHDEVFTPQEIAAIDGVNKDIYTAEATDHDELDCPHCKGIRMEHFNYSDTSGIILHKCEQCGGIWTDKDQLQKIEMLVDGWKGSMKQDLAKFGPVLQKVDAEEQQQLDRDVSISRFGFVSAILRRFCES